MRSEFNVNINQAAGHPERSEAKSKDRVEIAVGFATGFLDFARNDRSAMRTQALHVVALLVSCPADVKYAGSDCRAGQVRGQLRE
jgi:hypothetical protein